MAELLNNLRQQWIRSTWFRVWTIVGALVLITIILLISIWQLGLLSLDASIEEAFIVDLKFYLEASQRFLDRQGLYITPRSDFGLYAYSPFFALALSPLTFIPYELVWVGDMLLHLIAYFVLYWRWYTIFRQFKLDSVAEILIKLFPLWLVFTGLLNEIMSQNIYIFMALASTLLIEAMLKEHVGASIWWLTILLPIKPQWAFAVVIPLLLRRWRFLSKVIVGGLIAYLGTIMVTVIFAGTYALEQYLAYIDFLQTIPKTFFWNTLAVNGHIGYNNSIMQLVIFFTNNASYSENLTLGIKVLVLLPLLVVVWLFRQLKYPISINLKLEWAFIVYIGAFLCLDVVTELTLGIVILSYLLGTLSNRKLRLIAWVVFIPYALSFLGAMIFQPLFYALSLPYEIADPSLFIPVILIAMLGFYALLFRQMWKKRGAGSHSRQAKEISRLSGLAQ
jgi:hypothetical protein